MEPNTTPPATPITPNPAQTTPEPQKPEPQKPTAQKTHKTKNQALIINLIICAILAVAGIGFGIYGVITSNHYSSMVDDLKSMVADKDKTIASLKNPTKPEDPETPDEPETPEEPETTPYTTFSDNLAKNHIPSVFGYYYHHNGSENIQRTVLANIDQNCHLTITDLDNNDQTIAEADNVISTYFIHVGNGGVPYFYLIRKDGKVSRVNLAEYSDHVVETLEDYSNIVSIAKGSDLYAYLTDIDGNLYKTY